MGHFFQHFEKSVLQNRLKTTALIYETAPKQLYSPTCCRSRHVRLGFASRTRAAIPAASGADADVPVCDDVHEWCKSVVITCFSLVLPLL